MDSCAIVVRRASAADADVVARAVAMAIGDVPTLTEYCGEDYLAVLRAIVLTPNTQYSWHNALVAEVGGIVQGAIVGYDGALLGVLREGTFALLRDKVGRTPRISDETEVGEYYLDSIAVEPEFRSCGVGRALILSLCDRAAAEGHSRVGLIVDCSNPQAERLYSSLGFERVGERIFFGHQMWHLQKKVK